MKKHRCILPRMLKERRYFGGCLSLMVIGHWICRLILCETIYSVCGLIWMYMVDGINRCCVLPVHLEMFAIKTVSGIPCLCSLIPEVRLITPSRHKMLLLSFLPCCLKKKAESLWMRKDWWRCSVIMELVVGASIRRWVWLRIRQINCRTSWLLVVRLLKN